MLTRQDYIGKKCSHQDYYFSLAQAIGFNPTEEMIQHAMADDDYYLNGKSGHWWDSRNPYLGGESYTNAGPIRHVILTRWQESEIRKRGESLTMAVMNCIVKAGTRHAANKRLEESK